MPPLRRFTPSVIVATFSLTTLCLAAPARAQAPPPAGDPAPAPGYAPAQAAPPPGYPNATPGNYPPANQYPPTNGYPYPPQGGYGAPPPAPMPPRVDTPERFGQRGQVVITQGFGFISHDETSTHISLDPAVNFFVANNFSLGFEASLDHTNFDGPQKSSSALGLGLSLGFNIPMGSQLSLWPTLNNFIWFPDTGPNRGSTNLTVPILIHLAQHFFVAAGAEIFAYRYLSGGGSTEDVHFQQSLVTFIGGWW